MQTIKQQIARNKTIIMFILAMLLMIILACWVADQLIDHLDRKIPDL